GSLRQIAQVDAVRRNLEVLVAELGPLVEGVVDVLHEIRPQLLRRIEDLGGESDRSGVVGHCPRAMLRTRLGHTRGLMESSPDSGSACPDRRTFWEGTDRCCVSRQTIGRQ